MIWYKEQSWEFGWGSGLLTKPAQNLQQNRPLIVSPVTEVDWSWSSLSADPTRDPYVCEPHIPHTELGNVRENLETDTDITPILKDFVIQLEIELLVKINSNE